MQLTNAIDAILINKSCGRFPADNRYRLVFQTARGICSFQVSKEVYDRIHLQQKDLLKFRNGRLLSFGSIQESYIPSAPDRSWLRPQA